MKIRNYISADCAEISKLFYATVHTINAKDYTFHQLDAWAPKNINISDWDKSFLKNNTLVAESNNIIIGFADMDKTGYLNRLFVHKDFQGKGIASAILSELESQAIMQGISFITAHASVTAKTFFEKHGYNVLRKNKVIRRNIELTNFIMEKHLTK